MGETMSSDRQKDAAGVASVAGVAARARRPRGRPPQLTRGQVLEQIRALATRADGLFRVHRGHADLYARARRCFGSWAEAVRQAGLDYEIAIRTARRRSRAKLRKRPPASGSVNERT